MNLLGCRGVAAVQDAQAVPVQAPDTAPGVAPRDACTEGEFVGGVVVGALGVDGGTDLAEATAERDGLIGMLEVELVQELLCLSPVGDTAGVRFRGVVMSGRCGRWEGVGSHGFLEGGGTSGAAGVLSSQLLGLRAVRRRNGRTTSRSCWAIRPMSIPPAVVGDAVEVVVGGQVPGAGRGLCGIEVLDLESLVAFAVVAAPEPELKCDPWPYGSGISLHAVFAQNLHATLPRILRSSSRFRPRRRNGQQGTYELPRRVGQFTATCHPTVIHDRDRW